MCLKVNSASPSSSLDGTRHAVTRAGARPGDGVWVTGTVGKAAAGRFLLQHPEVQVPDAAALAAAYRRPTPRVQAGQVLAERPLGAMIDTSDGTASDLLHLVEASHVGVRLDEQVQRYDPFGSVAHRFQSLRQRVRVLAQHVPNSLVIAEDSAERQRHNCLGFVV